MLRIITQASDIVQELQRLQRRSPAGVWSWQGKVLATLAAFAQGSLGNISGDQNQQITRLGGSQLDAAYQRIAQERLQAIRQGCAQLEQVYRAQLPKAQVRFGEGETVQGQRFYPVQRAGFYLDAQRGDRLGNLLRQGMLAQTLGVKERVLVIGADNEVIIAPEILVAAQEMGMEEIYQAPELLAIAALGLGTDQIAPVESITGAGSAAVMAAKQLLSDRVIIDQILLRNDLLILADGQAQPQILALDLLAQGARNPQGSLVLLTDRLALAEDVAQWLQRYGREQEQSIHTEKAIAHYGFVGVVEDLTVTWEWVNQFAPQTLVLAVQDPWAVVEKVQRAGEIYIGQTTPTASAPYLGVSNRLHYQDGAEANHSQLAIHCFLRPGQIFAGNANSSTPWLTDLASWQAPAAIITRLNF